MAQLEQNNGDSLINEQEKENEKGKQLIEDITIKDEEKGKQLAKDTIIIGDISKIEINNDNMIVDNNNNNNNNNNCTLADLSELACQIDFDNSKKNDNNNNNNIINNNNNGHVATCVAGHSQTSTDDNTPLPLWVKWRNKWQTGIRCPLSDCPSSTLKAKPTHEMKSYIPVFFPRSKAYCWISTLHSRHISEAPEPLKNGSHSKWRKIVRDFQTVTKSHAMEKLALAMLSLTDQLHVQAVIEEARKGDAWKEFALEASACDNYSDLGNMLVKLRNMILSDYISSEWLKSKFESWVQKCRCAQNAESLESLTEELVQNILWNKIEELWTGSTQNNPTPEFKTLKQDMTKLFITSRETLKRPIQNFPNLETPQSSQKRPKLEVRRPGQQEVKPDLLDPLTQTPNSNNKSGYTYKQCTAFIESKGRQCERWANDGDVYCCVHLHASNGSDKRVGFANPSDPLSNSKGYTYRQCAAFIESKGRQCERWASDGDIYCCVHLYVNNTTGSDKRIGSDPLTTITTTSNKGYTYRQCAAFIESKGRQCERWASDGDVYCCVHLNGSDKRVGFVDPLTQTPNNNNNNNTKSGYTYKQCAAFIESKGRQCERWANEGDLYCCVHLNIRVDQNEKRAPLDSPLCKGTTTNGTNCKHRAKPGSNFCKKHVNSPIASNNNGSNSNNNGNNNNIKKNVVTEIISFGNNDNNGNNNIGRISFVPTPVPIPVPVFFENKPEVYNINKNNSNNNDNNEMICTPSTSVNNLNISELRCIGERANANENFSICQEYAKKYDLYCQNHIPKFLKRARDGRSRPITKEVILNLFKTCPSRKEKLLLHRSCELLYAFLKSKLLVRKPKFDMSDKMEIITSVVNNDPEVGEYLINLISHEREKLASIWGLNTSNNNNNINKSSNNNNNNNNVLTNNENFGGVKCKFCLEDFSDDHKLTLHWTQVHKKEARWLFRGYACKICMEGFNNRKLLESHIGEKHNALESVQELTLFRCISCNMHFTSPDPLWQHVLAFHVAEFKVDNNNNDNNNNNNVSNNNDNNEGGFMHRRGKYQLNRFKLNKNEGGNNLKNVGKVANIIMNNNNNNQIIVQEMAQNENNLGDLMDSDCINVAQILFSEIKKSKSHPSNSEILNFAKEACCKISLLNKLAEKFGVLPENIYLKAAKLCSESDVRIEWFKDSFICVNGCENSIIKPVLGPLNNNNNVLEGSLNDALNEMQVDEYHVVIDSNQFEGLNWEDREKLGFVLLCEDLSFGKEKLGIPCFLEREIRVLERENEIIMPWKDFTYVTERIFNQPIDQSTMDEELGCACSSEGCNPNKCDHVYLFDNDYENASDINGKNMHEKFAYDENGRIILQEGYPVYECNNSCKCDVNCNNRVIQKGICVKLEVFRTKSKGWAVRAGEDIKCGTFICEIIGEVINNEEATQRRERQKKDGCNYLCEIESHMGHMLSEETLPYVIDSFKYGNISRFINHSCSPNLSSYLVLSESMDCQLAHVALFANCDINAGEELCYDYKHKIIDGEKCYCGAHSCRGRI